MYDPELEVQRQKRSGAQELVLQQVKGLKEVIWKKVDRKLKGPQSEKEEIKKGLDAFYEFFEEECRTLLDEINQREKLLQRNTSKV